MIDLRLRRISMEGFKSFRGRTSVDFDGVSPGLYIITGDNRSDSKLGANGAGKSNLWDALTWCLCGISAAGVRSPDLLAWGGPKSFWVEVDLGSFVVKRTWNPNTLVCNGASVDALPFDLTHLALTSSILLGQMSDSFLDLTHQEQTTLISGALRTEMWEELSQSAQREVSEYSKKESRARENIAALSAALSEIDVRGLELRVRAWEVQHYDRILAMSKRAQDLKDDVRDLKKALTAVFTECESVEAAVNSMDAACKLCDDEERQAEVNRAKLVTRCSSLDAKRRQLELDVEDIASTKKCPCCGTLLKKSFVAKRIEQLVSQHDRVLTDITGAESDLKEATAELAVCREASISIHASRKVKQDELGRLRMKVARQEAMVDAVSSDLARVTSDLSALQSEECPFSSQLLGAKRRIHDLKRQLLLANTERRLAAKAISSHSFWVQGFRDLRLQLVNSVLQELSVTTTSHIQAMGLVGWSLLYDIDTTNKSGTVKRGFSVLIKSPASPDYVPWHSWSGGEKQRLRLAAATALSSTLLSLLGLNSDFEIWDEPNSAMTEGGVEELLQLLQTRAHQLRRRVFLIDHRQLESGYFSGELRIVKEEGSSSARWLPFEYGE